MKPYAVSLLIGLSVCTSAPAHSITIAGIEFSNPLILDIPSGSNVFVETTEDIYIQTPIFADSAYLYAQQQIVFLGDGELFVANELSLCSLSCPLAPGLSLQEVDIVLNLLGPVGDVTVYANNIVAGSAPIPEAGTGILLLFGIVLFGAACRQSRRRRPTSRCS